MSGCRTTIRAVGFWLLLAPLLATSQEAQGPPAGRAPAEGGTRIITAESLAGGRLDLGGAWRYHGGDDAAWADPELDDSSWPLSPIRFERGRLPANGWPGIGWFRLHLEVGEELLHEPLALIVFQEGASEIYLDGARLAQLGRVADRAEKEEGVRRREVVRISLSRARHVLAARHSNFLVSRLHGWGQVPGLRIALATPKAADQVYSQDRRPTLRQVEQILFTSVPLVFCVLHLLFFVFDRRARENLYFVVVTASFSAAAFFDYQLGFPADLGHIGLLVTLQRLSATLLGLSCLRFAYALVGGPLPRRFWWFAAAMGATWTRTLFANSPWQATMDALSFLIICALTLELLRSTPIFIRQRKDGTWLLGAGILTFLVTAILDQLMDLKLVAEPFLGTYNPYLYGGLGLLLSMSIYLARSFARTRRQLEHQLVQVRELSVKTLAQERAAREREVERRVLDADHARKTAELEEARQLQLALLPSDLPGLDAYDVAAAMRTATEVGGDYYDFEVRGDDTLLVAIGDAVGHGARAGTLVAATKSLFKALAGDGEPAAILDRVGAAIRDMQLRRIHMALALAMFSPGRLRLAAAGMPPALVHRAATGEVDEVMVEGLPLGGSGRFPYRQVEVPVAAGDTVLLLSDGFPELRNGDQELGYPQARSLFKESCAGSAREVIHRLEAAVETFTGGRPPVDDVTFVAVKVRG